MLVCELCAGIMSYIGQVRVLSYRFLVIVFRVKQLLHRSWSVETLRGPHGLYPARDLNL